MPVLLILGLFEITAPVPSTKLKPALFTKVPPALILSSFKSFDRPKPIVVTPDAVVAVRVRFVSAVARPISTVSPAFTATPTPNAPSDFTFQPLSSSVIAAPTLVVFFPFTL